MKLPRNIVKEHCGIGGISSDEPLPENLRTKTEFMFELLTTRGKDAWGYWNGKKIRKQPGDFIESEEVFNFPEHTKGSKNILLHTRRVSVGRPWINKNNHPWRLGRFVFAHNGYFHRYDPINWADVPPRLHKVKTDSFRLLYWIWKEFKTVDTVPEAIVRGLNHVDGGYACWLHDIKTKRTYLFRNRYPTFTLYYAEEPEYAVFASTKPILNFAFENLSPERGLAGKIYVMKGNTIRVEREYRLTPIPPWRKMQLRILFPKVVFNRRLKQLRRLRNF